MRRLRTIFLVLFSFLFLLPANLMAGKDDLTPEEKAKQRQELLEKLKKIRADKEKLLKKDKQPDKKPVDRSTAIRNYENTLSGCAGATGFQKNICADAIFSLSKLYYDKARDDYNAAQLRYEERFEKWERNPVTPRPQAPKPDYSKSLKMYQRAVREYPEAGGVGNGYFQIGGIYMLYGELDSAEIAYKELVTRRPNDQLASAAHFRIAQINFTNHNLSKALEHIDKMDMNKVNPTVQEMAHYRKSEIYYNTGDLDNAVTWFGSYVDKCDRGEFPRAELRGEAIEYMSVAFSDMPDGASAAIDYFSKKGGRSYEDTVIYTVGMKNFDHGQYKQCIVALETAIRKFPNFEQAPKAQMNIVNAYVIGRENEKANTAREVLANTYGKNSPWINRHSGSPIIVAKAEAEVKTAIGSIAIYYHSLAQEAEMKKEIEKSKGLYKKALDRYLEYLRNYPEEKWKTYEYNFYVGEAYTALGEFQNAASYYDKVAAENLSTFPEYKYDIGDTVGLPKEDIEELKKKQGKGAMEISQEEAGYNAIASLDTLRKEQMKLKSLDAVASYALPATKEFIGYIHSYQSRFPKATEAPNVLFLAASVAYDGKDYIASINDCKKVIFEYSTKDSLVWDATKLLGDGYAGNKEFDLSVEKYEQLLKGNRRPEEKDNLITLASGTIFNKAMHFRTTGDELSAAKTFRSIKAKYPTIETAAKGWFEAGASFENAKMLDSAATTFTQFATYFPSSDLLLKAYGRAATDWEKAGKKIKAAETFILGARDGNVKDTSFCVNAYGEASRLYKEAEKLLLAGDVLVEAYDRYPLDENAGKVLYSAGLIYENDAKDYNKAIETYKRLSQKFSTTVEGLNGAYSIGYCYQKMDQKAKAAKAFSDFAGKFVTDKPKQINALLLATEIYQEMDKLKEAEAKVTIATEIYNKFKESASIDPEVGAKAYYILGRFNHAKVKKIKLNKNNKNSVKANEKLKKKLVEPTIEAYMMSAGEAIQEWTVKSLYALAELNYDYAQDYREKTVFGGEEDKMVDKVNILRGPMPVFYDKAAENLIKLIQLAQEQGIKSEEITKAKELIMEIGYRKGYLFKEIGFLYRDAPIPGDLDDEEQMVYADELYNYYINNMAEAVPLYEQALAAARELHLPNCQWVDSMKKEIELTEIETGGQVVSEFKDIDLDKELAAYQSSAAAQQDALNNIAKQEAENLKRALAQIDRVFNNQEMSFEDKLNRLMIMKTDAERAMADEDRKILEYKKELGLVQ